MAYKVKNRTLKIERINRFRTLLGFIQAKRGCYASFESGCADRLSYKTLRELSLYSINAVRFARTLLENRVRKADMPSKSRLQFLHDLFRVRKRAIVKGSSRQQNPKNLVTYQI